MSLRKSYLTKEDLANDIISKYTLPEGVVFAGFDKYNRVVFDLSLDKKSITVGEMSELVGKMNFVDRYYQQNINLVTKGV